MTEEITNTPVNSPEKPAKNSPEKPKPAKSTAKSPDTPRITNSQKEKDPRKVAAGKKLGAISRMAKSQKKLKAEVQKQQQPQEPSENYEKKSFNTTVCVVVAVAVAGFVALGYFKTKKPTETPKNPEPNLKNNPNLISL